MALAAFFNEQARKLLDMASRCQEPKMADGMRAMADAFLFQPLCEIFSHTSRAGSPNGGAENSNFVSNAQPLCTVGSHRPNLTNT
jgi:hypothetical protein